MPGYFFTSKERDKYNKLTRFDTNFNMKRKVLIESFVAAKICRFPSDKSLQITHKISLRLQKALAKKTISGNTLLHDLIQCKAFSLNDLESRFSPLAEEVGRLPDEYMGVPLDEAILKELSNTTDKNNFCIHLHLTKTLAEQICGFFEWVKEKSEKSFELMHLLLQDLKSPVAVSEEGLQNDRLLDSYETLLRTRLAKPLEAKKIRVSREIESRTKITLGIIPEPLYSDAEKSHAMKRHVCGTMFWRVHLYHHPESEFLKTALKQNVPLIAGVSDTTARWVSLVDFMGFSDDEKKVYYANASSFMVFCGNHSAYETAISINRSMKFFDTDGYRLLEQDYASLYKLMIPEEVCPFINIVEIINRYADNDAKHTTDSIFIP